MVYFSSLVTVTLMRYNIIISMILVRQSIIRPIGKGTAAINVNPFIQSNAPAIFGVLPYLLRSKSPIPFNKMAIPNMIYLASRPKYTLRKKLEADITSSPFTKTIINMKETAPMIRKMFLFSMPITNSPYKYMIQVRKDAK